MAARLNLTLVVEEAKRLRAARAIRTAFKVDIDMVQFLTLDWIADRLDAADLRGLAAARGARRRQTLKPSASLLMRAEPLQGSL